MAIWRFVGYDQTLDPFRVKHYVNEMVQLGHIQAGYMILQYCMIISKLLTEAAKH